MTYSSETPPLSSVDYLGLLVGAAVSEAMSSNDEYGACYETMRSHAVAFNNIMRNVESTPDMALFTNWDVAEQERRRWHKPAQYERYDAPIWVIKGLRRYGGGNLGGSAVSGTYPRTPKCIAIDLNQGNLLLARVSQSGRRFIDLPGEYNPSDFINPDVFDKPGGTERLLKEWADDVRTATLKYTRKG